MQNVHSMKKKKIYIYICIKYCKFILQDYIKVHEIKIKNL